MGVGRVPSTGGHGMVGEVRGGSAFAPHRLDFAPLRLDCGREPAADSPSRGE